MCFERARVRNHIHSYGGGSMCVQNISELSRIRRAIDLVQTVFSAEILKLVPQIVFWEISSALVINSA